MPSREVRKRQDAARYVFVNGFGARSSKRVAFGLSISLTRPIRMVLFLEGTSGACPRDVTMQTGASKPGFRRLKASVVEETNGFVAS